MSDELRYAVYFRGQSFLWQGDEQYRFETLDEAQQYLYNGFLEEEDHPIDDGYINLNGIKLNTYYSSCYDVGDEYVIWDTHQGLSEEYVDQKLKEVSKYLKDFQELMKIDGRFHPVFLGNRLELVNELGWITSSMSMNC